LENPTVFALRKNPSVTDMDAPGANSDLEDRAQSERAIACAACAAAITSPSHRIAINGLHEHRFMNPAGNLFHIGCFAHAVGCTIIGPDSLEYPWFPGFAWRFAMCGACGQHLGWHFRKRERGSFFGLILDRLVLPAADG
jgi:hypothetical protein